MRPPTPPQLTVQHSMLSGCHCCHAAGVLSNYPEAIIHSSWVASSGWDSGPELLGWVQHSQLAPALEAMKYAAWPYTHCSGVCKVMVNPTSDMLFQVRDTNNSSQSGWAPCHGIPLYNKHSSGAIFI